MSTNKGYFSEEELTALANQISSDSPFLLDTDIESDITIKPPFEIEDDDEQKRPSLSSHIVSSSHTLTHSLPPKPRLSIVNSRQMPANDSFNMPLPPIPFKQELEDNGLYIATYQITT